MWIGVYEFQHCLDVPWRVVLNECIELAKEFGGTDGHKYVNAVLNSLAPKLRPTRCSADSAPNARCAGRRSAMPTAPPGPVDQARRAAAGAPCHEDISRAQRIEPFYVMEVAKAARPWRREVAAAVRP
jgi:hypothetical protein